MDKSRKYFTPIVQPKIKEKIDKRKLPKDRAHGWTKKRKVIEDIRGFSYPKDVLIKAS